MVRGAAGAATGCASVVDAPSALGSATSGPGFRADAPESLHRDADRRCRDGLLRLDGGRVGRARIVLRGVGLDGLGGGGDGIVTGLLAAGEEGHMSQPNRQSDRCFAEAETPAAG